MLKPYLSSDEDDYDEYDFGYSEEIRKRRQEEEEHPLPDIQNPLLQKKIEEAWEITRLNNELGRAAEEGDVPKILDLIQRGVHVDSCEPKEWTPLMKACVSGNSELVQILLDHGSDPNKAKGEAELFTPLMACCTNTLVRETPKLNCLRLLLQHGANVNAKDKHRTTALMYAIGSSYSEIATELLAVPGIDLNMQDREGWTALFHAVNFENKILVEKLIAAGSKLSIKDRYNRTPLRLALDRDNREMAKLMGYVEKKPPEPRSPRDEMKYKFLDELPDSEGNNGFLYESRNILNTFNQNRVKDIGLTELLSASEEDLKEIGVKLQPNRLKILSLGIHKLHLEPWSRSSMQELVRGKILSLKNIVEIIGSSVRHLCVLRSSLQYLDHRISTRKTNKVKNLGQEKELLNVLVEAYFSSLKIHMILPKILKHAVELKEVNPPDFIEPHAISGQNKKKVTLCLCALGAGAAALVMLSARPTIWGEEAGQHYWNDYAEPDFVAFLSSVSFLPKLGEGLWYPRDRERQ